MIACVSGNVMDRSNLYLKLFKLVFGSVSLFAAENEQMLKVCSVPKNSANELLIHYIGVNSVWIGKQVLYKDIIFISL